MNIKISRILHAGYVFEHLGTQIAFDPIFENPFSRNCYAFPDVRFDHEQIRNLQLGAVFISHYHDDHCSLESLAFLDRKTPIYIYCLFEEIFALIKALGFVHVYPLKIDIPVIIGSLEIIPRKALDSDVDSMFQIKGAGLNILNVVDSWIDPSTLSVLEKYSPWDMVLWPFQTMREIEVLAPSRVSPAPSELPAEWLEQLKILNPRYVVPSSCQFLQESWSWYNHALFPISYGQFKLEIEAALPNSQVVRLNPSLAVALDKNKLKTVSSLSWVQPIGEQDVDYHYNQALTPPLTAEISRQFPALSIEQAEEVFEYCRSGLLEKYQTLDATDGHFQKERFWRLAIFDHKGEATYFHYRLNNQSMELSSESEKPLSWSTEIPISKFYAALNFGESLTSMYMRINDLVFDPEIEKEIQSADIVDDPLIRCLFNGVFGAYQMAQLKRLNTI